MATPNYNLPTISGNMTADVVRDMNALAEATDGAIKEVVSVDLASVSQKIDTVEKQVNSHLAETKMQILFRKSLAQSIPDATRTPVLFDVVVPVNSAAYAEISNGRIKILQAGLYLLVAKVTFASQNRGKRTVRSGDNSEITVSPVIDDLTDITITNTFYVNAGELVSLEAYQTSGVAIDVTGYTRAQLIKMG